MKKKYYLRGLGLGILVTALVFIITGPDKMSDAEIIKRAEELGYVKQSAELSPTISIKDLLETGTPAPTPTQVPAEVPQETTTPELTETPASDEQQEEPMATSTPIPEPTFTPTPTPVPTETPTPTPEHTATPTPENKVVTATIVIERGNTATMVCNKMQEAGIVKNGEDFKQYLVKHNLTDYINVGTYTISSDMSYKEMAKLLTGR